MYDNELVVKEYSCNENTDTIWLGFNGNSHYFNLKYPVNIPDVEKTLQINGPLPSEIRSVPKARVRMKKSKSWKRKTEINILPVKALHIKDKIMSLDFFNLDFYLRSREEIIELSKMGDTRRANEKITDLYNKMDPGEYFGDKDILFETFYEELADVEVVTIYESPKDRAIANKRPGLGEYNNQCTVTFDHGYTAQHSGFCILDKKCTIFNIYKFKCQSLGYQYSDDEKLISIGLTILQLLLLPNLKIVRCMSKVAFSALMSFFDNDSESFELGVVYPSNYFSIWGYYHPSYIHRMEREVPLECFFESIANAFSAINIDNLECELQKKKCTNLLNYGDCDVIKDTYFECEESYSDEVRENEIFSEYEMHYEIIVEEDSYIRKNQKDSRIYYFKGNEEHLVQEVLEFESRKGYYKIYIKDSTIVEKLKKLGNTVHKWIPYSIRLSKRGDLAKLKELVETHGLDCLMHTYQGKTPLEWAKGEVIAYIQEQLQK
eukprot:TRINITY_DN9777_c0_g1_i1.p1 TRINITY_DN9777_c0_g1~~TRINITY_DN9777_c0_g1_i1.p1  ORF type:complete len:508 (+),score=95.64 TRINITY_DN9777_c0_g1_i1:52-1524(+)